MWHVFLSLLTLAALLFNKKKKQKTKLNKKTLFKLKVLIICCCYNFKANESGKWGKERKGNRETNNRREQIERQSYCSISDVVSDEVDDEDAGKQNKHKRLKKYKRKYDKEFIKLNRNKVKRINKIK